MVAEGKKKGSGCREHRSNTAYTTVMHGNKCNLDLYTSIITAVLGCNLIEFQIYAVLDLHTSMIKGPHCSEAQTQT